MGNVVRVKEVFAGHFECRHCDLDVPAQVRAVGWGGERPTGLTVEEEAIEDASGVASRTLQFVPCPRCGKLDPTGRGYRIQVIVGVIVLGALLFGGCYLFLKFRARHSSFERSELLWMSAAFGALMSAILYWKWSRPWRGAAKRTRIQYTRE